MRFLTTSLVILFACAATQAAPVAAAPVATITVALTNVAPVRLLPAFDANSGRFSGNFVLCDGSVLVGATACASPADSQIIIDVSGSVFPEITGAVSFTDFGAPTALAVTFGVLIPVIPGAADTEISGSFTVPQTRTPGSTVNGLFGFPFIAGGVFAGSAITVINGPDSSIVQSDAGPVTRTWDPIAGTFDCATVGGCANIYLAMGFEGRGGGDSYQISGRFDIDDAAAVPLPATLPLLAVGLGLLGFITRRRR